MALFDRFKKKSAQTDSESNPHPRELIVPLIAGQAWMDANDQTFSQVPDLQLDQWPFARPFADGLWAAYASDANGVWEMVQYRQAAAFGGADAMHALAAENAARRSGGVQVDSANGCFSLRPENESADLTATLVLEHDQWRSWIDVDGPLAIALPTRAALIACSANDSAAVETLTRTSADLYQEALAKPITPQLYLLDSMLRPFPADGQ